MRTTTDVTVSNDVTCCHNRLQVPFARDETIDRLRRLVERETYDEDLAAYVRIDGEDIVVHVYGFDCEGSLGELNRILHGLWRVPR